MYKLNKVHCASPPLNQESKNGGTGINKSRVWTPNLTRSLAHYLRYYLHKTLFIAMTMFCGTDNNMGDIPHIHTNCDEYSMEYCQFADHCHGFE